MFRQAFMVYLIEIFECNSMGFTKSTQFVGCKINNENYQN